VLATEKFRSDNPKTYRAFVDALAEAAQFATKNPEAAADLYIRVNKAKIDRALLVKILKNPQVQFKVTPQNTFALAEFMYRVGAIKHSRSRGRIISSRTRQPPKGADMAEGNGAHLRVVASHEPLLQVDGVSLEYRTAQRGARHRIASASTSTPRTASCCSGLRAAASPRCSRRWRASCRRPKARSARRAAGATAGAGPHRRVPGIRPVAAVEDGAQNVMFPLRQARAVAAEANERGAALLDKVGWRRLPMPIRTRCPAA
jgi:hypothetical protein